MPRFKKYRMVVSVEFATQDEYNAKDLDYPTTVTIQRKMGVDNGAEMGGVIAAIDAVCERKEYDPGLLTSFQDKKEFRYADNSTDPPLWSEWMRLTRTGIPGNFPLGVSIEFR